MFFGKIKEEYSWRKEEGMCVVREWGKEVRISVWKG